MPSFLGECPVIYPTEEEFLDFNLVTKRAEEVGQGFGIVRVVPPKSWAPRSKPFTPANKDFDFAIKTPVQQNTIGTGGVFKQYQVEKKETTFLKYAELATSEGNRAPSGDEAVLSKRFWASMGTQTCNPPVYAADVGGVSLFEDCAGAWNLQKLNNLLREKVKPDIEGVTTATLFAGMWRTCFAWHTEDYDLFAINFNHYGAPKHWWAIPPQAADRFNRYCESLFPTQRSKCGAFMRHKSFLVSPHRIRDAGIPLFKCVQNAGEFVITLPAAYHAGFNHGFNVAEACNFALPSWIPYGLQSRRCKCRHGTVEIDMRLFTLDPFSPTSTATRNTLHIGDIVWASVPRHPAWPARICIPATNAQRRELEAKQGWHLVLFLGPQRHWAVVPPRDLQLFDVSFQFASSDYVGKLDVNELQNLEMAVAAAKDEVQAQYSKCPGYGEDDTIDSKARVAQILADMANYELDKPEHVQHKVKMPKKRAQSLEDMTDLSAIRKVKRRDEIAASGDVQRVRGRESEKRSYSSCSKQNNRPSSFARDVRRATNAFGNFQSALAKALEVSRLAAAE